MRTISDIPVKAIAESIALLNKDQDIKFLQDSYADVVELLPLGHAIPRFWYKPGLSYEKAEDFLDSCYGDALFTKSFHGIGDQVEMIVKSIKSAMFCYVATATLIKKVFSKKEGVLSKSINKANADRKREPLFPTDSTWEFFPTFQSDIELKDGILGLELEVTGELGISYKWVAVPSTLQLWIRFLHSPPTIDHINALNPQCNIQVKDVGIGTSYSMEIPGRSIYLSDLTLDYIISYLRDCAVLYINTKVSSDAKSEVDSKVY